MDLTRLHSFEDMDVPLTAMGTTRPFFRLERRHSGKEGQVGLALHLPPTWKLSRSLTFHRMSKSWVIDDNDQTLSAPGLRQVVLIPDSLAFERDTLLAPISQRSRPSDWRSWERVTSAPWHLWLAGSMTVLRPDTWLLSSPLDPATWRSTQAMDTYAKARWFVHRFRLEVGTLADVGAGHRGRRSASQLPDFLVCRLGQIVGRTCHALGVANPEVTSFCVPWP